MVFKKINDYGKLVMFSHTIFSLSFALMAILIVSTKANFKWLTFMWIMIALLSARTGANALNRLIDAKIDAKNPRTQSRQLPKKQMSQNEILFFVIGCFILMVLAASQLNLICLLLSPVALFLMTIYSYTKRFTWLCHLILGLTCACAPVGAILAITGQFSFLAILMGSANMFWVAGFDIIYGAQDYEFDKLNGLYSIPVRFGVARALDIAKGFHVIAFICLFIIGLITPQLAFIYFTGLLIIGGLFVYQHAIVSAQNLKQVKVASYSVNQVISLVFLGFGILDIVI